MDDSDDRSFQMESPSPQIAPSTLHRALHVSSQSGSAQKTISNDSAGCILGLTVRRGTHVAVRDGATR